MLKTSFFALSLTSILLTSCGSKTENKRTIDQDEPHDPKVENSQPPPWAHRPDNSNSSQNAKPEAQEPKSINPVEAPKPKSSDPVEAPKPKSSDPVEAPKPKTSGPVEATIPPSISALATACETSGEGFKSEVISTSYSTYCSCWPANKEEEDGYVYDLANFLGYSSRATAIQALKNVCFE